MFKNEEFCIKNDGFCRESRFEVPGAVLHVFSFKCFTQSSTGNEAILSLKIADFSWYQDVFLAFTDGDQERKLIFYNQPKVPFYALFMLFSCCFHTVFNAENDELCCFHTVFNAENDEIGRLCSTRTGRCSLRGSPTSQCTPSA